MNNQLSKFFFIVAFMLVATTNLSSCSSTSVYGSVGVGVGTSNFNRHSSGSGRRMHGSISVGGRIR